MKRWKTALIGLGRMGRNHYRALVEHHRFELNLIVDPNVGKRRGASTEIAPVLENLPSRSELAQLDCAIVASSTPTHSAICRQLVQAGVPVLVEKPLARSYVEAAKLVRFAKLHRVPVWVGHVERFNPAVAKLQEVLRGGALGRAIHFAFTRVGGYPESVTDNTNVLLDLAVHDLDVLSMLAGDFKVMSSVCHSAWRRGLYDTAEILLKGEKGSSASIHVNWISPTKIRTIRVTGTKGVCFVDYMLQTCSLWGSQLLSRPNLKTDYLSLVETYQNSDRIDFGVPRQEPLKRQLDAFSAALEGRKTALCSAAEAALAVKLAEGAIKSSEKLTSVRW